MDDHDRRLLIELQKEIPLVARPFETIGRQIGLDSAEVLLRIQRFRNQEQLDRIGGFFDSRKIGYQTAVLAMSVPETEVSRAAIVFSAHPGICQCALFQHRLNLWCLIGIPAEESLESHLLSLQESYKPQQLVVLKTLKSFKPPVPGEKNPVPLAEDEKKVIRLLQEEFPLTDEPFRRIGRETGLEEAAVLNAVQQLKERGVLKKIAVAFAKEKSHEGLLILWQTPEEKSDDFARKLAEDPRVRFCYKRTSYPELPYALHTVVDLDSPADLSAWITGLETRIGSWPYAVLAKQKDFKKTKLIYFPKEREAQPDGELLSHKN